ncbi:MAG: GNAT family N-acetyltransferase [Gammaproteobacteria bacterium]|nr:GNAT family N-acetyltransferase [Gammaproteobacteria bacterium]
MPLTIRPANLSDLQFIQDCNVAMAAETEDLGLNVEKLSQGISYIFDHKDEGFYLIAERASQSVGTLMVTFEWSDWRSGRFWWIQSVFVTPAARRSGVYRALHQQVRDLASKDPQFCGIRLYVEKQNVNAQNTYKQMGMQHTHYAIYEELA